MALTDLIERYKRECSEMGHRQKAELEAEIVRAAREEKKIPKGSRLRDWMCTNLGGTAFGFEFRYYVMQAGAEDDMDAFWAYIDKAGLSTSAASTMMIKARRLQSAANGKRMPLSQALEKVMLAREYPNEAPLPDVANEPKKDRKPVRVTMVPGTPADSDEAVADAVDNSKDFWKGIRVYALRYVASRTEDLDEASREELLRDFETDIKVAVYELFRRITRTRRGARDQSITMLNAKLGPACKRLGIPRPRNGQFDMKRAKRQYKLQAFSLHPDRNSDPSVAEQYKDVQESWQIIQEWWETTGKGKNP